ncbi:MAG: Hsp20/alpha crystallin family protein [Chloroflexi bacterium]|nr:Hsp20/alpha crystallin family protein [Chloroflexota bacterium]
MTRIIRWTPVRSISDYSVDRLFDESWRTFFGENTRTLVMDVSETDTAYHASIEVPGVNAEDINISLEDNILTIEAEIAEAVGEREDNRALLRERRYGTYSRSLRLPHPVDVDNIEATYNNGILELDLPKVPEAQPRQIKVKSLN